MIGDILQILLVLVIAWILSTWLTTNYNKAKHVIALIIGVIAMICVVATLIQFVRLMS